MGARILSIQGSQVKLEVAIDLSRSLLRSEENIPQNLNEAGCLATSAAVKYLDTDGSAIEMAGEVMRTKGEQAKGYQTPYGEVVVHRHVYQRSGGGKTYCPIEREGRIVSPRAYPGADSRFLSCLWISRCGCGCALSR
jgi:hypothetical protein